MENLENVKVGDNIVVSSRFKTEIKKVKRITPTLVICEKGKRFRKTNGVELGNYNAWNCAYARPATDEDVERINEEQRHTSLVRACANIPFVKFSSDQLTEILTFINNLK